MENFAAEDNPSLPEPAENPASSQKIRKVQTGLRVRQPEELMMRPETGTEKFHLANPDNSVSPGNVAVASRPTVTAEQLTKALENLKTNLRNERQGGESPQKPVGSGIESPPAVDDDEPNRASEFRPTVNFGTR